MFPKNKSLPGFTLFELIVVMLISSMLFGIIYQAYQVIQFHYIRYEQESQRLGNLNMFFALLEKDVEESERVYADGSFIRCISVGREVEYQFYSDMVLRHQGWKRDTFFCQALEKRYLLEQKEVFPNNQLIDELIIMVNYKEEQMNLHVRKIYAADVLYQEEISW
jgi:prepilin-type N-terminal cleavage/methylation domain-containing protein